MAKSTWFRGAPVPSCRPGRAIHLRQRVRHITFAIVTSVTVAACSDSDEIAGRRVTGGNPDSGKLLIEFYACGSCHVIPGIAGAEGMMGPPLTSFGKRSMIAGAVANEPERLVEWIVNPHTIEPGTAMPAVGATEAEARDIAAYLYTLR